LAERSKGGLGGGPPEGTIHKVAAVDELEPETAKRVVVDGVEICLARTEDGTYYAIGDTCSHEDYSLSEGDVWDEEVECPAHGSRFHLATGAVSGLPATQPVPAYRVRVEGDDVLVELEPHAG
jgi:3-phenylpropionate/trans-cinnamate dioxygenase ferredoxin component